MTHRSPGEVAVTVFAAALALLAAAASVLLSPFFVMATDPCGADNCDFSRLTWAYVVTWGGVAVAVVLAVVGMALAARRRTRMWIWPVSAFLLVVVTFAGGVLLAGSVVQT